MTVILLHGIGNYNPGWSRTLMAHHILGISSNELVEFNYEDLMENNWINQALVTAARVAASYYATPAAGMAANYVQDYVDDVLTYFVVPGVRKKILARFAALLEQYPDVIIIGFSLGSIVAYEAIKNYPKIGKSPTLITIGSPLGSPTLKALVKKFLKVPDKNRPVVKDWFNFYSRRDILSGPIEGLGCEDTDQFKVRSNHKLTTYLQHIKTTLPDLFS